MFVFDEEWFKPHLPQISPVARVVEQVAFVFVGIAFPGTTGHLWRRSYDVPFDLCEKSSGLIRRRVAALATAFFVQHSFSSICSVRGLTDDLEWLS